MLPESGAERVALVVGGASGPTTIVDMGGVVGAARVADREPVIGYVGRTRFTAGDRPSPG